ncbi:MAG TPA: ABC transporter substrate-binding protein [Burkholderiales bacterium]|nr:ABC transporter substrate-binding protein [Burkholderiales bacterium]
MKGPRAGRIAAASALVAAALGATAGLAVAQDTTLRVNVFPGAQNLPIFIGLERGVFAKHGLKVELQNTPSSQAQRSGLAEDKFEIAHGAVDNAVAMVEAAGRDVVVVMGGDASMNEFMVRPEIGTIADIRGKVVAVDAPNTAYALVAKKILKNNGLIEGRDYTVRPLGGTAQRSAAMASNPELVAGIVNLPFSITVREKGLKSLGRSRDLIGPYQATAAFVMRPWAQANGDALERYIAAYVESLRIAMDPVNRAAGAAALATHLRLDPKVAEETIGLLMIPGFGLAPDARLDMDGFRTVLALRAEIEGQWGGKPPAPDKYLDLGYYDRALKRLGN